MLDAHPPILQAFWTVWAVCKVRGGGGDALTLAVGVACWQTLALALAVGLLVMLSLTTIADSFVAIFPLHESLELQEVCQTHFLIFLEHILANNNNNPL